MSPDREMRQIQELLLILLKKFHALCMENDIQYSLHGGTLLGAVREKGFIPWDDDADVTMTRKEYEKFVLLMRHCAQNSGIGFIGSEYDRIPRAVLDLQTEGSFVWIDIFVYDCISGNWWAQKIKLICQYYLAAISLQKEKLGITKLKEGDHRFKYFLYKLANVTGRPFPMEKKAALRDWFAENAFCGKREYIHRSNDQYIGRRQILPADVMERYTMLPFEDTELMVTSAYDRVLVSSYGPDYRTPKRYPDTQDKMHEEGRRQVWKAWQQIKKT